jgi:hypothetical protein
LRPDVRYDVSIDTALTWSENGAITGVVVIYRLAAINFNVSDIGPIRRTARIAGRFNAERLQT